MGENQEAVDEMRKSQEQVDAGAYVQDLIDKTSKVDSAMEEEEEEEEI